jgi:thymidylate synthase
MTISLIACVTNFQGKLAIGRNNDLVCKLKEDTAFFKHVTSNSLSASSKIQKNVVVMGRKTWFSLPLNKRPLKDRINIILTNDKSLHKLSPFPKRSYAKPECFDKDTYFFSYRDFLSFYAITNPNVFVIGGADIYRLFLKATTKPTAVYLTEVTGYRHAHTPPNVFMDHLDESYRLAGVSEKFIDIKQNVTYRFLTYRCQDNVSDEHKYLELCREVLNTGTERPDRTGVGTISTFGKQLHFDISQCVPLMTTKRVPWKHVVHELLWFLRGDTDARLLQAENVTIWNGNTSREFLDSRGLNDYPVGVLGAGYGWQMRFFGANYSQAFSNTAKIDTSKLGGFDQLAYIVRELKTNPYSRRIMMCYWNPPDFEKCALLPCHYSCQFHVDKGPNNKILNCHFTMRSSDTFLGLPFNLFSYAVLTYVLAIKCDMIPGKLVYTGGDVHIYNNHISQVYEQISRDCRPLPKLLVNHQVKYKDFKDITIDDFDVVGYFPHPSIKADMAV